MSSPIATLSLTSYAGIIAARLSATIAASSASAATTPATPTSTAAPPSTAAAQNGGIILSATPPPNAAPALPPSSMDLNLTNLLTGSSPSGSAPQGGTTLLQSLSALPPELLKPQVIEAVVLKSTLLPTTTAGSTTPAQQPQAPAAVAVPAQLQARVELAWQGRVLQLLSPQPLPVGSQVRIEVNARGELKLLPPTLANSGAPTAPIPRAAEPALPPPLQQALRESLPRQRPLSDMQPLLQRLLNPAQLPKLPAPVAAALQQLAASLPRPQQLQSAEGVRQAVTHSGNFLEARVATTTAAPAGRTSAAAAPNTNPLSPQTGSAADAKRPDASALLTVQAIADEAANGDIKAQLLQAIAVIRRFAPPVPTTAQEAATELLYSARPQPKATPPAAAPDSGERELEQLQQLNRLLQGGLARVQLNQLDSAASRQVGGNDSQPPVPSWTFELPIHTARGSENLQLRIEQQAQQKDGVRQLQWRVQLAFDLHELGKLAATLVITGGNVAATLWAEQQHTHRVVRAEVDHFKAALEGVGVRVTELQCRLGLPPAEKHRWQQQLVDVRT